MREKIVYLTTNKGKMNEAEEFFIKKYGIELEIMNPNFEVLEIQADNCADIAAFSAEYAANRLKKCVLKSDTGLYIDALGGLPGPYNHYFDEQIGVDRFLDLLKGEKNRNARIEHCFAFCKPGEKAVVFKGGNSGSIAYESKGRLGRWHDKFFIPNGENMTLSELREMDYEKEASYWGDAKDQFALWYLSNN